MKKSFFYLRAAGFFCLFIFLAFFPLTSFGASYCDKGVDPDRCNAKVSNWIQTCANCDADPDNEWCNTVNCAATGKICLSGACQNSLTCVDSDHDSFGKAGSTGCAKVGDDCNDSNPAVHPGATEICGNGVDEDCTGADLPCPDTTLPVVAAFDVQPRTTTGAVTATFTVTDDVQLKRVDLYRADYKAADCNEAIKTGCVWSNLQNKIISGASQTGNFTDAPASGSYWYGLHVIDEAGNTGVETSELKVTKSGGCAPNCAGKCGGDDGCGGVCANICSSPNPYCAADGKTCVACLNDSQCVSPQVCDSSGKCADKLSGNRKLLSKFGAKEIFLIPDDNWQEAMSLVSLTTWTAQDAGEYSACHHVYNGAASVCAYPTLIYHREAADTYDADSILYFINQYSANQITAVNSLPAELAGQINGKGLTPDLISPSDYLAYWQNYDEVVYAQNDYQLALLASTFASLKNAPLAIQGTSLDRTGTFINKKVYTVGSVACPAAAATCQNFANVAALEQAYYDLTHTDKLVLVNYNDLSLSLTAPPYFPEFSSSMVSRTYANQSLSAPLLASAKHELLISDNATGYLPVDSFISSKIASLSIKPKYLTIVAYPDAIQMSQNNLLPHVSGFSEVDSNIYGDINGDFFPDMAVGRIFSLSPADVSANIARSLYYSDISRSNNFAMLWPDFFYDQKIEGKANDVLLSAAGLNKQSVYLGEGASALDYNRDLKDKFIINYLDHGNTTVWGTYLTSSQFNANDVWLNSSLIISDACLTCAYNVAGFYEKRDLFCSNILRHGGLAHLGAVDQMRSDWSGMFSKQDMEMIAAGETLGDSLMRIKNENVTISFAGGRDGVTDVANEPWLVLLGDPTFKINSLYPTSLAKIQTSENVARHIVTLSIPENSSTLTSYTGSDASPRNYYTYVPAPGKELSRDYMYWDGSNSTIGPICSTGGANVKTYYLEINNNYSINILSQAFLIKKDGSESLFTINFPVSLSKVKQFTTSRIKITPTLELGLQISVAKDVYNNKYHLVLSEYNIFYPPCSSALGQTIPAHSYSLNFN